MKKVYIATPCYGGEVHATYARSLAETYVELTSNDFAVMTRINTANTRLDFSRNNLISEFMQSEADYMLCIDSDLGWGAKAVMLLLSHDVDFVCGIYPKRKEAVFEYRPLWNENGKMQKNELGLLKMECIPAGFMLLKREAIQKMIDHFPELFYEPEMEGLLTGHKFFSAELIDKKQWGEDYMFCKRAIEAGIEIWADPRIEFDHAGNIGAMVNLPDFESMIEPIKTKV